MSPNLVDQAEYLASSGQICPRCRSDQLNFYDSENEIGAFIERIECENCRLDFKRVFKLAGYEILRSTL